MKALLPIAFAAATATAYADCPYPTAPAKLPDGATATMQDMIDGQNAVKGYDKAINDYIGCIDKELDDAIAKAGKDLKPEQKKHMQELEAQKHNAAIDELQSVATRFNEQVKVFKARTADKKG
jgi:hypothetical protein